MQREILFRGKRVDNGEWVEGSLDTSSQFQSKGNVFIIRNMYSYGVAFPSKQVDPSTVGQFTGLMDKNGNRIFEGDVVKFIGGTTDTLPYPPYNNSHKIGAILVVKHLPSGYTLCLPHHKDSPIPNLVSQIDNYTFWNHQRSLEVIGNIHDNPELLS